MNRKMLGGLTAVAAVATGSGLYLAGPALAGDSHSDTVTALSQSPKNQRHPNRPIRRLRRIGGVHGQTTVRTKKGFVQVAWQRGRLTASGGGTVTVRSLDGTTWQWSTNGTTKVGKDGRRSTVAALAANDYVFVAGRMNGGTRVALRVLAPKRVPAKATQTPTPSPS